MKHNIRGMVTIPLVMTVVGLAVVMAFTSSWTTSNVQKAFEKLYSRRLLYMVANSAFEEACARLEKQNTQIPFAEIDQATKTAKQRNLKQVLGWTAEQSITPKLCQDDLKDDRITIDDVKIKSSDWILQTKDMTSGGTSYQQGAIAALVRECGILEMKVKITIRTGSTTLTNEVTARRYVEASPDVGSNKSKLRIQPNNMVLMIGGDSV